ncbi:MAG: tetratricopeptide repeat protein [Geminicoccaceae bacterium]
MVMRPEFRKCPPFAAGRIRRFGSILAVVLAASPLASGVGNTAGAERVSDAIAGLLVAGPGIVDETKLVDAAAESTLGDYLAGNFALDTGNIKDAASYFERALADDPDNLELRRQVFLLDLADARYGAALAEARSLKEQEGGEANEDVQLLLALEQVKAKSYDAVADELSDVGNQGIVALAAPFVKAWSSFGQDGTEALDEAIALLHEGESLGPLNEFHDAMLLALGDKPGEALVELEAILPESGAAPSRVAQAYAEVLARAGLSEDALAFLEAQLAFGERPILRQALIDMQDGGTPGLPFDDEAGGVADALLGIAEALQQERGSARAILYTRLALYLRPDLSDARLLIGDILAGQENNEAAIEAYDAIPETSPFSYAARVRKAQVLHGQEEQEQAFGLLGDLAKANPERTDALIELGNLLRRDELYARAEKAYSEAIERIEAPEQEHWSLYYSRGITFERTKRWREAEADFLFALELQPEQPFVLNYLGYSWVDQGENLDQAKDMLNRAVAARPDDGFIVDSLGWVHYRLGDFEQAVDQLERAVELQPGDPVINDHLGDAYWRVGREREASFQWRRALTLEPEDDLAAQIREKLKSGLDDDRS